MRLRYAAAVIVAAVPLLLGATKPLATCEPGSKVDARDTYDTSQRSTIFVERDLSCQDLRNVDFTQANLSGANLSRAILTGADLGQATLDEANLREAVLTGADLV